MPKGHLRLTCRVCERHIDQAGSLSKRGKCSECASALVAANMVSLVNHTGPFHEYWRRRHAAAVGAVILDDLQKVS